jgi:hypothetical protein
MLGGVHTGSVLEGCIVPRKSYRSPGNYTDVQKSRDVPKSCAVRAVGTGAGNTDRCTSDYAEA